MRKLSALLVASLASSMPLVRADAAPGDNSPLTYLQVQPNTLASAMMLGLIDEQSVFILDKTENNPAKINGAGGTPVWGSIMNLTDYSVRGVEVNTNTFCASGGTLGNGTWIVAGGNNIAGYGGGPNTAGVAPYFDYDGRRAVRLLEPSSGSSTIEWIDDPAGNNHLATPRWYPAIEVLATGEALFVGGAVNGGYINRNTINSDPAYEGDGTGSPTNINGAANPTYEYWPRRPDPLEESKFMISTSGLNMYAHTFLMPSGRVFMQANYSTVLWDHEANKEYKLPDMTDEIIRVYPASAAVAMLPLTPANGYVPTILFCGGTKFDEKTWGWYGGQASNILSITASTDCSSITPELANGKTNPHAAYDSEEQMPEGRTMGQFIHLPTGQMLIVNGANKGTAGYINSTFNQFTFQGEPLYTEGLAQDPIYTPLLYDPEKPKGSRLSNAGFGASQTARLYHSSALLLPDGGVLITGSNPHVDVTLNMPANFQQVQVFNTSYEAEVWRPDYYFKERPKPQGLPSQLMYGGDTFNVTMDAEYMGASANAMANSTKFMVIRPGFSTHAVNFGQRSLQLDNTYIVNSDGSVTYIVNPLPTNLNLVVPGPALLFVTIDGVPSLGKYIMCGDMTGPVPGKVTVGADIAQLPPPVNNAHFAADLSDSGKSNFGLGKIIAVAVAGAVLIALVAGLVIWRRRKARHSDVKLISPPADSNGGVWASRNVGTSGNAAYVPVQSAGPGSTHSYGTHDPFSASAVSLQGGQEAGWESYRLASVGTPTGGYSDAPARAASPAGGRRAGGVAAITAARSRNPIALAAMAPQEASQGMGSPQRPRRDPGPSQQTAAWGHSHQAPAAAHSYHNAQASYGQGYSDHAGAYYEQSSNGAAAYYQPQSPGGSGHYQQPSYQQPSGDGYAYSSPQAQYRGGDGYQAGWNGGQNASGYGGQREWR